MSYDSIIEAKEVETTDKINSDLLARINSVNVRCKKVMSSNQEDNNKSIPNKIYAHYPMPARSQKIESLLKEEFKKGIYYSTLSKNVKEAIPNKVSAAKMPESAQKIEKAISAEFNKVKRKNTIKPKNR